MSVDLSNSDQYPCKHARSLHRTPHPHTPAYRAWLYEALCISGLDWRRTGFLEWDTADAHALTLYFDKCCGLSSLWAPNNLCKQTAWNSICHKAADDRWHHRCRTRSRGPWDFSFFRRHMRSIRQDFSCLTAARSGAKLWISSSRFAALKLHLLRWNFIFPQRCAFLFSAFLWT